MWIKVEDKNLENLARIHVFTISQEMKCKIRNKVQIVFLTYNYLYNILIICI